MRSGEHGFQHHWPQTAERRTAWEVWGGRAAGGGGGLGGCGEGVGGVVLRGVLVRRTESIGIH